MQEQRHFFLCQIDRVPVLDQHSGKIRTGTFVDRLVLRAGERDQLFQREPVDICQPDEYIDIRDPFACLVVGVCLTGNVQSAADLLLCVVVPVPEVAQIFFRWTFATETPPFTRTCFNIPSL